MRPHSDRRISHCIKIEREIDKKERDREGERENVKNFKSLSRAQHLGLWRPHAGTSE